MPSLNRDELRGLDFYWYAIDRAGNVAQFISGFGPIPELALSDADTGGAVAEFFSELPIATAATLVDANFKVGPGSPFRGIFEDSERGLFTYNEGEYNSEIKTYRYELYAQPAATILVENLPDYVKKYLEQLVFRGLLFRETSIIEVQDYFRCID